MIDSSYLLRLKRQALKRRVWFRTLSSLERGLVDLVVRIVDRPKSPVLIDILAWIVVKVKKALMSPLERLIECIGRSLAKKISIIALKCGNKSASEWAHDKSFIRYLTVMDLNNPPGFRLSDILATK